MGKAEEAVCGSPSPSDRLTPTVPPNEPTDERTGKMERVATWYEHPRDAERAERLAREQMTPNERVAIVLELVRRYYDPSDRLERVLRIVDLKRR